jgi:hypothetical protein
MYFFGDGHLKLCKIQPMLFVVFIPHIERDLFSNPPNYYTFATFSKFYQLFLTKTPTLNTPRRHFMKIERIFNSETSINLENILYSIINEKIDSLIAESYANDKVNSTVSSSKGGNVA